MTDRNDYTAVQCMVVKVTDNAALLHRLNKWSEWVPLSLIYGPDEIKMRERYKTAIEAVRTEQKIHDILMWVNTLPSAWRYRPNEDSVWQYSEGRYPNVIDDWISEPLFTAQKWQPIDTAEETANQPDRLLLLEDGSMVVGCFEEGHAWLWTDHRGHDVFPTHWMPLPGAPE